MFPPKFIVTELKPVKKTVKSQYADVGEKRDTWYVGFKHSFFVGNNVDMWFPTEEWARVFSKYGAYTPEEILNLAGSTATSFVVHEIAKTKVYGPENDYTGKRMTIDAWRATLENTVDERLIDFIFPTEEEVREKFDPKQTYTLQDLFGTVLSVPEEVSAAYEFAASHAIDAEIAAEIAATNLEIASVAKAEASYQAALVVQGNYNVGTLIPAATTKNSTAITANSTRIASNNAWAAYNANPGNSTLLTAAINADALADHWENQAATYAQAYNVALANYNVLVNNAQVAKQLAIKLAAGVNQRTIPYAYKEYTISMGGAAGWYDGKYYASGTFRLTDGSASGQFYGTYSATSSA